MNTQKITTDEAAKIIGKPVQWVRIGLRTGRLNIGTAVKMKRWTYHISPKLLEEYIGKI